MRKNVVAIMALIFFVLFWIVVATPAGQLAFAYAVSSLFERSAPEIARGILTADPTDRIGRRQTSQRFTAALLAKFPIGSPTSALASDLLWEGFDYPHEESVCVGHEGHSAPLGNGKSLECPSLDWRHTLDYDWRDGLCHDYMEVRWSADRSDRIRNVVGQFEDHCM